MNSQELETAVRLGIAMTVLVLHDGKYGVIQHHMDTRLGRHFDYRENEKLSQALGEVICQG